MRDLLSILLLGSICVSFQPMARAAVIHVPSEQATIQAGIGAATHGDSVVIAPGVYQEHGLTLKSGVSVVGAGSSPADVAVDGQFWGRVFSGTNLDAMTLLGNLTVTNGFCGYDQGGAMWLYDADLHISHVRFAGNTAYGHGAAIYCDYSSPTFTEVTFSGNRTYFGGQGGAIYFHGDSHASIEDSEFTDNQADCGGAIYNYASFVTITGTAFEGNSAANAGGAVFCGAGYGLVLDHVLFHDNTATTQGGALSCSGGGAHLSFVTFRENDAGERGGGMNCGFSSDFTLSSSTFYGNAASQGGALYCEFGSPWLNRVIVAFSESGGGVYGYGTAEPVLACCDVFGNTGGDYAGTANDQTGMVGNISADPLFCAAGTGDLTLEAGSPCAEANSACHLLVGAWNVGCGWPSGVQRDLSWGRIKAMYR
jgi:predicted outer membrane repeat protein